MSAGGKEGGGAGIGGGEGGKTGQLVKKSSIIQVYDTLRDILFIPIPIFFYLL